MSSTGIAWRWHSSRRLLPFEHVFELGKGAAGVTDMLDGPPLDSLLSLGDPGDVPPGPDERPYCEDCQCQYDDASAGRTADPVDPGSSVPQRAVAEPTGARADTAGNVAWATPGVPQPAAGPSPLVADLRVAVDALDEHGALSGLRADTTALLVLAERARALATRELAEMDTVGGFVEPGVRSTTASWLRDTQQLTDPAARAQVHLAVQLRDTLPELGALHRTGQITSEHAAAVVAGLRGLDQDLVRDAQPALCALARTTDPSSIRTRLRDMATALDDRLAADAERRARERMGLRLAQVGAHTAVDGTLAGEAGATVRLAMDLAVEAGRADGDTRGRAARQADVLVDWASDYLVRAQGPGDSLATDAHTVRTHLHITCTPEQLHCAAAAGVAADGAGATADRPNLTGLIEQHLAGGLPAGAGIVGDSVLSRAALRRLACDASLDLVALSCSGSPACRPAEGTTCPHRSDPLYVGRSTRTVTGAQFKALVVRDRTCVVKGCSRPPARCAAHHVRHWADGGGSDLDNLVLLCHQHHHDHHDRGQDLPHQDGRRRLTRDGWGQAP